MKQYIDLIEKIIETGYKKTDRTGVGTTSIFGHQMFFDLSKGFPLLTLKDTHFPSIVHELLWFLNAVPDSYRKYGNTNIKYLVDHKVNIWNEWALKDYLKSNGKSNIKADPNDPLWKEEMKLFIHKITSDENFALQWGSLGSVYGKQWTQWPSHKRDLNPPFLFEERSINQIELLIKRLKEKPDDRGLIVSAWNVDELESMALRPCHTMWQVNTHPITDTEKIKIAKSRYFDWIKATLSPEEFLIESEKAEKMFSHWWYSGAHPEHGVNFGALPFFSDLPKLTLDLQLYQRSMDTFLGCPFNIASYSLLLHMIAQVVDMSPGKFIHTVGDAHIYQNHMDATNELLTRVGCGCGGTQKNYGPELPTIELNPLIRNINDFRFDDIKLINYTPLSKIKAPIAI